MPKEVAVKSILSLVAATLLSAVSILPFGEAIRAETVTPAFRVAGSRGPSRPARSRARLNVYQRGAVRDLLAGSVAAIDTLRLIGIQVQFADSLMPADRDSSYFGNELRHLENYFHGASRGNTSVVWEVTPEVYNLPREMAYYGEDEFEDVRVVEMMQSAIDSADADIDFSRFDTFQLIHSDVGQETDIFDNSRTQVFSTFLDRTDIDAAFPDSSVFGLVTADSLDGEPFLVDNFMVVPQDASQDGLELGSLGIWAFVTGSRLGLLPLFDSEPSGFPDSRGIGDFDLMSSGLFNELGSVPGFPSAFNRVIAGWVQPRVVEEAGQFRLRDINSPVPGDTACLKIPITESEYFLVVNRVHDTNFDYLFTYGDLDSNCLVDNGDSLEGAEFDYFLTAFSNPLLAPNPNCEGFLLPASLTGSGLYIWHVDEAVIRQNIDAGFLPNDFSSRKGVDLEEADGIQDMDGTSLDLSFGSHFDAFREGNNARFGPDTEPGSWGNSGASSGIVIRDISAADSFMTCVIQIDRNYEETRTRWRAAGEFQPATPVDLDGFMPEEIVVFADTGRVYAFGPDGREFIDKDGNPDTVEPYFVAPGAVWVGPPAFGDVDGGGDHELIATSESGAVYAWKGDSTEVVNGDNDPLTRGVLYQGLPAAAGPMLVDVAGDAAVEVCAVERSGDSLRVFFLDATGAVIDPSDPDVSSLWPARIQAQNATPLALGTVATPGVESEGIVIGWADSIRSVYGLSYIPVRTNSTLTAEHSWEVTFAPRGELRMVFPAFSPPAVADIDRDETDEVILTVPDGRIVRIDRRSAQATPEIEVYELRSSNPSAPAVGDLDGDGAPEIAVWDQVAFYVLENSLRLRTNWPVPKRAIDLGSFPLLEYDPLLNSPLIVNVDGDTRMDVIFPTRDGTLYGFHDDGGGVAGFPRNAPSSMGTAPTISDVDGDGEMSLTSLGIVPLVATVDAVSDTMLSEVTMILSLQSLPGSDAQDKSFWTMYHRDVERTGQLTETNPVQPGGELVQGGSFIVYPNPLRGGNVVRARIVLNQRATVSVEIFNLEGERAFGRDFEANQAGLLMTPFDEPIQVGSLASGIYLMRLSVAGQGRTGTFVKTFAILK